jgi:hypothetical protein
MTMFWLRTLLLRRLGPLGLVLTALDLWRRVPKHRRRQLRAGARRHGSRLAGAAGAFAARSAKQAKARVVESASSRG